MCQEWTEVGCCRLDVSVPQARVVDVSVPTAYGHQLVAPFRKAVGGRWSPAGGGEFLRPSTEVS